jgi:zinc ribbon protein
VNPCRQCGADLPEQARFCHQCGMPVEQEAEQKPATPPPAPPQPLEFIQPALAGGMFLGLFSSLPFISAGNCICCAWVLGGGALATLLLTKQRPSGVALGDGAFVGVLSGLFGAVVATLVSIPVRILSARFFESQQQALEDTLRQIGAEGPLRDLMLRVASPEISATTLLFTFFMNLLVYSLFAMIGGILTVAVLERRRNAGVRPRSLP